MQVLKWCKIARLHDDKNLILCFSCNELNLYNKHLIVVVLLFVNDKGGEIYELILWVLMLWLCHVCIIENIWIDDNYDCHICIMPCLHHIKISRTSIVILLADILSYDEMLRIVAKMMHATLMLFMWCIAYDVYHECFKWWMFGIMINMLINAWKF